METPLTDGETAPPRTPSPQDADQIGRSPETLDADGVERPNTAADFRLANTPPTAGTSFAPDDRFYRLEQGWISLRRLGGIITVMMIWGASAIALAIVSLAADPARSLRDWLWIGWAVTGGGFTALALLWPGRAYRHYMYRVDDARLEIRRGLVWRSVHDVPRNRIQHLDVGQGPIERLFDLTHVVVHTAGSTNATVKVDGLREDVARKLRDVLLVERGDDGD